MSEQLAGRQAAGSWWLAYLVPGAGLDDGEAEFRVVGVHGLDLFLGGGAEDFDDFDELVDSVLARENGLAQHELGDHAACGWVSGGGGGLPVDQMSMEGV